MLEYKLITIYLTAKVHLSVDEHLGNYFREGWELSEMIHNSQGTRPDAAFGWLVVKLTRPKAQKINKRWDAPAKT